MRRFLLVLGIALVLGSVLGQAALAQFDDAPKMDSWVYESFKLVYDAGLIRGYPDGTFRGGRPATRNEVVEFMARLMNYFEQRLANAQPASKPAAQPVTPATSNRTYLTEEEVKALIAEELAAQNEGVTQEELEAQTDELYDAIMDLEESVTDELDELDVRVTTLEERVDAVEQKNEDQDEAIAKLQTDLQAVNAAMGDTQSVSAQDVAKAEEAAKKAKTLGIIGIILGIIGCVL